MHALDYGKYTSYTQMRTNTAAITVLSCALALPVGAQSRLAEHIDSVLAAREEKAKAKYDTAYIAKPGQKWTVKLRGNVSGTGLYAKGMMDDSRFKGELEAEMRSTVGATVSYHGLSLGFAINPAKLSGRSKDNEFTLTSYGNRIGADLVYTSTKTLSGTAERGGERYDIGAGMVDMKMIQANAYYVFSHSRFSFPAAFTQSQVQLRSKGSWLLGLSAFAGRIDTEAGMLPGISKARLQTVNVAIGGGYAYNFVIKRKWLLHLSAIPHVVVFSRNKLTVEDTQQRTPYRFPSLINVGRFAVVRNFKHDFIGLSAVINLWHHGDSDEMMLESLKWRARLFYGFRF